MQTKLSRKILNYLQNSKQHKREFRKISKDLQISIDDIKRACTFLVKNDCAEFFYANQVEQDYFGTTCDPIGIELTEIGLHYRRWKIHITTAEFVRSILCPIIVAIITSAITALLLS